MPQQGGLTMAHDSHTHQHTLHSHEPVAPMGKAFFLTVVILAVEVAGGLISHSLALLSDAGHVLTDVAAIGLSWLALKQSQRPSNRNMTYGYYRSGILIALFNAIALIVITLFILWEAYGRFRHPQAVAPAWMFVSAGIGLTLNLYLGLGMRTNHDLNVKSVVLHMLGDAAASAGVIVGGIVMLLKHWYVVDAILSVLIAILIASGAWQIVRQTVAILMEGAPAGIDFADVVASVKSVPGVLDVHDVHIWSIASGRNAMSCHVVLNGDMTIRASQSVLRALENRVQEFGIGHVTIQTEDGTHPHGASELCATSASDIADFVD